MKLYKTLIVDDEKLARERLKDLLTNFKNTFQIIGEATNGNEAEKLIEKLTPDILFLDIEMPGKNGFELLNDLKNIPIIIFCTAYENYALKAFDSNSIDYLVKPIQLDRLKQTVRKLKSLQSNLTSNQLQNVIHQLKSNKEAKKITSLSVKKKDKIILIKLDDIYFFEANEKYVNLHTNDSKEIIEQSLLHLEEKLPDHFLRIHRKYIVNTFAVKDFQKYFNSRYLITLKDNKRTMITTGRSYKEHIKSWLKN